MIAPPNAFVTPLPVSTALSTITTTTSSSSATLSSAHSPLIRPARHAAARLTTPVRACLSHSPPIAPTPVMDPPTAPSTSSDTAPHPVLANAALNRGRRFAEADRAALAVDALVPSGPARTLRAEVDRLLAKLSSLPTPLLRYEHLLRLASTDEQLFFAAAQAHFARVLPLIYTPTVGEACLAFPTLDVPPRGLWLSLERHAGRVEETLRAAWPRRASVVVVSDCERILGLGDLGANGMPIPVGKLLLYTACGGVPPAQCLPVVLDVGCNTAAVRDDPDYIGTRAPRASGEAYDAFVAEFLAAVRAVHGPACLVQFEDFGNANALPLLRRYRDDVCCFNDDIQGTAAVGLAGVLAALRIPGVAPAIADHRFLFLGAGSAGLGIAELIVLALVRAGVPEAEARRRCWFVDSRGLVYAGRERVSADKAPFAHDAFPAAVKAATAGLPALVDALKPTALIGVSTQPGSFSPDVIARMAALNERPLVFALSNPTSKSECTAEEAYQHSEGRAVFASGSPFAPVTLPDGTARVPGQGNNSYVFPGLGLGVLVSGARVVPDSMLLAAADRLADLVDDKQLELACVYPDVKTLMDISANIAHAVCQKAVELGVNSKDVADITVKQIRERMYEPGRGQM